MFTPYTPKTITHKNRMFTGADTRNHKSSMLYDSNLRNIIAGKYQYCVNSMLVNLRRHHLMVSGIMTCKNKMRRDKYVSEGHLIKEPNLGQFSPTLIHSAL